MKLAIGCTRAGLDLKDSVIPLLEERGHAVADLGMQRDGDFVPYYQAAANVAGAVSRGEAEKAIIICGTGAGSVIVANKFKGVHAVHASSAWEAGRASAINAANVLCLGEWVTPPQQVKDVVDAWLDTPFGEGFAAEWIDFLREGVDEVGRIEAENLK